MSLSVDDLVASLNANHIGQEASDLAALQVSIPVLLSAVATFPSDISQRHNSLRHCSQIHHPLRLSLTSLTPEHMPNHPTHQHPGHLHPASPSTVPNFIGGGALVSQVPGLGTRTRKWTESLML